MVKKQTDGYAIIPLENSHWPEVSRIYAEGLSTGQASFETKVPTWQEWDEGHLPKARFVAFGKDKIIGWAGLSPVSNREVYIGVCEVSVYIDLGSRGRGVGFELLKALVNESESLGIWTLQASIFPENQVSIHIHEKVGFRILGRREKIAKHFDVWRDTIIMERRSKKIV